MSQAEVLGVNLLEVGGGALAGGERILHFSLVFAREVPSALVATELFSQLCLKIYIF